MKDRIFLLASGVAAAIVAWVFWHFLGGAGFAVLCLIAVFGITSDNRRLRKKVHELENKQDGDGGDR